MDSAPLQSFADAEITCRAAKANAKLITIHSPDEQSFLSDFLYTTKRVVDNIWLGGQLTENNTTLQWKDNSNLTFTNWSEENPKNHSTRTCVQMHADEELRGRWSNEPCAKKNLVVCERKLAWSMSKMQELIESLMLNQVAPIPVGFTYVQLPKEKSPQEIWPSWMVWSDVSDQYDSNFFRVAGSKSAAFGDVQEEFSPYIDEIKFIDMRGHVDANGQITDAKLLRNGGWTGNVLSSWINEVPSSANHNEYRGYHNFHTAAGEVRPRNMAVKVWKRTG